MSDLAEVYSCCKRHLYCYVLFTIKCTYTTRGLKIEHNILVIIETIRAHYEFPLNNHKIINIHNFFTNIKGKLYKRVKFMLIVDVIPSISRILS